MRYVVTLCCSVMLECWCVAKCCVLLFAVHGCECCLLCVDACLWYYGVSCWLQLLLLHAAAAVVLGGVGWCGDAAVVVAVCVVLLNYGVWCCMCLLLVAIDCQCVFYVLFVECACLMCFVSLIVCGYCCVICCVCALFVCWLIAELCLRLRVCLLFV